MSAGRATRRPGAKPVRPAPPAPSAAPEAAVSPASRRPVSWFADPWAWLTLLAVVPLVVRMAGAPWGEPVAEDFDFLRRALLEGMGTLLDGGGSQAFWRPIPFQLYYAALGRVILGAPAVVAVFHLACLAAAALLVQRALRPGLGGAMACVAATFPLLAESTRTLASWSAQFVDVGLGLGCALAIHAAARRRHALALAALGLALLCKEVAVVAGLLLPLVPGAARNRRERLHLAAGSAAVLAAWGLATLLVRRSAGLALPRHIVGTEEAIRASAPEKAGWALEANLRAALSLPRLPTPDDLAIGVVLAILAAIAAALILARREARARLARAAPWAAWGFAWFALGTAAIAPIYPAWQPNRGHLAAMGLGVATTAALGAAHPALAAALAGVRLVLLARAPGPARIVTERPPETGAFMDYPRLTRLQVFMRASRRALARQFPTLPSGSIVVQHNLPHGVEYALGRDRALQCWYRDSTLRWMRFDDWKARRETPVTVILSATAGHEPPVGLVNPDAMRGLFLAVDLMSQRRYAEMLSTVARIDSLQRDTCAFMFRLRSGALRAYALVATGRAAEAESLAAPLVALDRRDALVRQVLGRSLAAQGRLDEASAQVDTLLAWSPGDSAAAMLARQLADLRAERQRARGPR